MREFTVAFACRQSVRCLPGRTHISFSPEFEFLLACCAVDAQEIRLRRVKEALGKKPNWPDVLRLGEHHSVLPLLYRSARDFPAEIPTVT